MRDLNLSGKRLLIREDFNVPVQDTKVSHTARIQAALPTIQWALAQGATVILVSHLGRPVEGRISPEDSLEPVRAVLSSLLNLPVALLSLEALENSIHTQSLMPGSVTLLENVRCLVGEAENSPELGKRLGALCDIFVMDAFAVAHRAQASTVSVAVYAPVACAGPLLIAELEAVERILASPQRPVMAIVGGAKVSTKLALLNHLLDRVDTLILGGGIANTFLRAQGYAIGDSLFEPALVPLAQDLLAKAQKQHKLIWLPQDVVVADNLSATAHPTIKSVSAVHGSDKIFDIGPQAQAELGDLLQTAQIILWNGPLGVFEYPAFSAGTQALAQAIAKSRAFSVAGGGDTLAAVAQYHVTDQISYLSTGGGAFLEALEGKILPAVAVLTRE